jgi:zinc protease
VKPRTFTPDSGKKLTLADVIRFHADFFGASDTELAVVGDFDPGEVQKLAADLLGTWKSPAPYTPLKREWRKSDAVTKVIQAPGYYNAFFVAATAPSLSQSDTEFSALAILNTIIGGNAQARLPRRIREVEKLDCDLRSELRIQPGDDGARFVAVSQCDPPSIPKVQGAFRDEMRKLLKNGVSTEEFDTARKAFIEQWQAGRMEDRNLARLLNLDGMSGRTRVQEDERRRKVSALFPEDLIGIARRHLDLASFSYFMAGRF